MDEQGRHERRAREAIARGGLNGSGAAAELLATARRLDAAAAEREGYADRFEQALTGDEDDPLAAAERSMVSTPRAEVAPTIFGARVVADERVPPGWLVPADALEPRSVGEALAAADASLGNLTIPATPGEFDAPAHAVEDDPAMPTVWAPEGALVDDGQALREQGWNVHVGEDGLKHVSPEQMAELSRVSEIGRRFHEGDPGDEQEHVDRQTNAWREQYDATCIDCVQVRYHDVHRPGTVTETVKTQQVGGLAEFIEANIPMIQVAAVRDGEGELVRAADPALPFDLASLADDEYVTLERWPAGDTVDPTATEWTGTDGTAAVREQDDAGTVRELRLLPGGAVDLRPRRKVQAWCDLRFQYLSDHLAGDPDEAEADTLREIGALVEKFGNLVVANETLGVEGMALVSVVGHVLDKPGDPDGAA
jgi:hypothetical protein